MDLLFLDDDKMTLAPCGVGVFFVHAFKRTDDSRLRIDWKSHAFGSAIIDSKRTGISHTSSCWFH